LFLLPTLVLNISAKLGNLSDGMAGFVLNLKMFLYLENHLVIESLGLTKLQHRKETNHQRLFNEKTESFSSITA